MFKWLESEYEPLKTKNEKFCETLKEGEMIVVWNFSDEPREFVRKFISYDKKTDRIRCNVTSYISSDYGFQHFDCGRKLTSEEKGSDNMMITIDFWDLVFIGSFVLIVLFLALTDKKDKGGDEE